MNEGDLRTTLGRNIHTIRANTNEAPSKQMIKERLKFSLIPEDQQWRVSLGQDLMNIRGKRLQLDEFNSDEINEMLKFTCVT